MRLSGAHGWGEPQDREEVLSILRATVENGINFIDTADFYEEDLTNRLIAKAIYPYPEDLIIFTKVGSGRTSLKDWHFFDQPEKLRETIKKNLHTPAFIGSFQVHARF